MKEILAILVFVNSSWCSEGHIHEQFRKLSYSNLRSLYAQHHDGYRKFVEKYKQGLIDDRPEPVRLLAYAKTVEEIRRHNALYEQGKSTYKLGLNKMADMSMEEFKEMNPAMKIDPAKRIADNYPNATDSIPDIPITVDWVKEGYVTPVKEMTPNCSAAGAALSVAGTLEALVRGRRKKGKLLSYSAQELVDCAGSGCKGTGNRTEYFKYIVEKGGLQKQGKYPWKGETGQCPIGNIKRSGTIRSYFSVLSNDINSMKAAIARGPVSVTIYTNLESFKNYKEGIFRAAAVPDQEYTHTMLAVGYAEDYILLKNNWGTDWGEKGYMRVTTNKQESCNVLQGGLQPF